jgi:heme/copper-type cytochrome/quinol oxidase subunit 3
VLWFNSIVLLASSAPFSGPTALEKGDARAAYWWSPTLTLGLLFLAGQVIAWRLAAQGVYVSSNPNSSFSIF